MNDPSPPPAKPPRVSVLLPVYNAGGHLRRALDSLAAQTFRDFEAVALDDGSTDSSLAALEAFAAEHPFLRVGTQANAGAAETRNRLLRMARGEFVLFLDDDDAFDPDCVERFVAEADRTGADVVCGGYRRVAPDGRVLHTVRMRDPAWSPLVVIMAWAKIFRRGFLLENGVEFFDYGIGEDIPFCFKAYKAARSVAVSDFVGYNWTFNETSVSNTAHRTFSEARDPVPLFERLFSVSGAGGLYRFFYVRHVVWHLLYSGRGATPDEFVRQTDRFFAWLASRGVPARYPYRDFMRKGGDLKAFFAVSAFLWIRRLHLVRAFARLYCRP